MKKTRLKIAMLGALAACALTPSASLAASDILFEPVGATVMTDGFGNQFGSTGAGGRWQNWYANIPPITNFALIYDTTNPPPTGSVGSMYQTQGWDGSGGGSFATYVCEDGNFWGGTKIDMGQYESIEMDFKFDTNSTMLPATQMGFDFGVNKDNNADSQPIVLRTIYNTGAEATNFDGAWHHLSTPIPQNIAGATFSEGPAFKMFHDAAVSGTFNYWVANIKLVARLVQAPPPTVNLKKTVPGLKQFADATPNYNRQSLRTDLNAPGGKDIDWIGNPGATYSWTIAEFPGASAPNFQAAFTLTPDDPTTMTYADPDWSATNCLWLQIQGNNDGTVRTLLAWKTNQPAGNSQLYGSGMLLNNFNSPTAVGTWSLSFPNNTSVTLTAPGGASTNLTLPADMFVVPYTGVSCALVSGMNNTDALVGQSVTYSSFQASNVVNPVNEDLTDGSLSTPFLILQSQGYGASPTPPNQVFVTSADAYWLSWTLPDTGFFAEHKNTLTNPTWSGYTPASVLLNGANRWAKIPAASLASLDSGYFRLIKRPFTKLQVLMPGETAAPNTPTGKTGTPDAQTAGLPFNLTVRSVDDVWNVVSSSDTVNLTSTDGTATLPADAPLAGGTVTMTITFGSSGTFTATASDVTDPTKTANTGSPTLVP
jgi:hypothetical protein